MIEKETEEFYASDKTEWRKWLKKNHKKKDSVWLICYQLKSGVPTLSWSEAVEEALCFGWIDSKRKPIDHEKFIQFYSKRKAKSTWSKINKDHVERLISEGKMTQAGLDIIEIAKKNGSWDILNDVDALIVPEALQNEFKKNKGSKEYFESLSKSNKKILLQWIVLAKLPETKAKRMTEIARSAAEGLMPEQFRRKQFQY